jgi:hypothetical protein
MQKYFMSLMTSVALLSLTCTSLYASEPNDSA